MAAMHVESFGGGKPLVMLHGWGMHGGIWGEAVQQLAQSFRVHCVDLPGHGYSKTEKGEGGREKGEEATEKGQGARDKGEDPVFPFTIHHSPFSLDSIVDDLSAQFNEPLNVCGWSLGGQIVLRWAQRHPEQVEKLVLVASTPCFMQRADWSCAMAAEVLQAFSDAMTQDYQATLKRFLALQVRGSENERELLQSLRERLFNRGEPDIAALHGGLAILRDTDLRTQLAQIAQAALVIAGARDTMTPPAASAYLAQALPNARLENIAGAAHAPFLSHPEIFVKQITDFLHE